MRRGLALLLALSAVGWLTPSLFGQYPPYPYAPPVYGPPSMPYGYYPPPMPMPMPMPQQAPRVYVYGPLDAAPSQPMQQRLPDAGTVVVTKPTTATKAKATVTQTQAVEGGKKDFVAPTPAADKPAPAPSSSSIWSALPFVGSSCGPDGCDEWPETGCATCRNPRLPGHGQFIFDVGAYVLVPYPSPRQAYNTSVANQPTSANDFPQDIAAGPRISLGYLAHNGLGIRANYWYLNNSQNQSASNSDPATIVQNPLGDSFKFKSPSQSLANGIGQDNYNFSQTLNINVADLEVLREHQFMDTTFLFGLGLRYARVKQGYGASVANTGGANGVITVTQDQQDASASNVFEGWGPTVSLELIHAIPRSHFAIYGNVRGSFLWGTDDFNQSLRTQNKTVNVAGAANFVDSTANGFLNNHREASIGETEFGLQYGTRCGSYYVFVRAGADLQRWWNVGSPTTANGNLGFIGGTARLGISY